MGVWKATVLKPFAIFYILIVFIGDVIVLLWSPTCRALCSGGDEQTVVHKLP